MTINFNVVLILPTEVKRFVNCVVTEAIDELKDKKTKGIKAGAHF